MQIDRILPEYQFSERHSVLIQASPRQVYESIQRFDFLSIPTIRVLMFLRSLPGIITGKSGNKPPENSGESLSAKLATMGFVKLYEETPVEIVFGLAGQFWKPTGNLHPVTAEEFPEFKKPGFARAAWNFYITADTGKRTKLSTETRIVCYGNAAGKFRPYWFVIRPFSGLIRIMLLRKIKSNAEKS